ncbi:hypothetical protein EB061_11465 [bacterium]|nr:hypothetical protein [bacterium]
MKRIATLFAIFHCVIAPAFAKKGTQSSGLVTHYWKANRLPASKAAMPCADDVERMKDIAAEQFGKMDLDSDGHKISVSKEAFKSASVSSALILIFIIVRSPLPRKNSACESKRNPPR